MSDKKQDDNKQDHPPIAPGTSASLEFCITGYALRTAHDIAYIRDNQIAAWMRVAWELMDKGDFVDFFNVQSAMDNARAWDRWRR